MQNELHVSVLFIDTGRRDNETTSKSCVQEVSDDVMTKVYNVTTAGETFCGKMSVVYHIL